MGKCVGLLVALAACQPMYKGPSERMKDPKVVKHVDPTPPKKEKVWVDACNFNMRANPQGIQRQPTQAQPLVNAGAIDLDKSDKETREQPKSTIDLKAVDDFSAALRKDPYDADATLGLARAYDHLARRGCALALLKRLDALTANTVYAPAARRAADQVRDHKDWFKDYRNDALAQLP